MFEVDENMLFWAFRYALGRRTGAVTSVIKHLKKHWFKLREQTQMQIRREIIDAIKQDRAGDECDVNSWKDLCNCGNPKMEESDYCKECV